MCAVNCVTKDILQLFKRTLNFFQTVGILHSYTFEYPEIVFSPNAEKYLQNLISILEEIKVVLTKLYGATNTQVFPDQNLHSNESCTNLATVNNHLITADLISTHLITSNNQIILGDNQLISESSQLIQSNTLITSHNQVITSNNQFVSDIKEIISSNNEVAGELIRCSSIIDSDNQIMGHGFQEEEDICRLSSQSVSICNKEDEVNTAISNVEPDWNESVHVTDKPINKSYECTVCNKKLSSKTSLNSHLATHTGQKSFCCEHCGKLFTTSPNLSAHLTRQHNLNTESALSCSECGKLFVRKSALDTHLACHMGLKLFQCNICKKSFTQKVTRDNHVLTHTKNYQFMCSHCPKKFANQSKLNFHLKSHSEPQYCCNLCKKKFTTKQYLTVHYKTHNLPETETPHCRLDTVPETTQVFENTEFKCKQCSICFSNQGALAVHGPCKYNPLSMGYQFPLLDQHNQQKKHFSCKLCGQDFLNRANFHKHQKQDHNVIVAQEKRFACHLCPKKFTAKRKLNIHLKNHSQELRLPCEVCGRTFSRGDSLKRHMLLHSSIAKYTCVTCGRLFHTQAALNRHTESHTAQYQCLQCGLMLKSKTSLKFHIQSTHEGNYKFTCSSCSKRFVRKCHYKEHLRTHSTERPFKCDTCGRTFKDRKHLREHLKRVHSMPRDVTMQLLESITTEDALTNQHSFPMVDSSHCIAESSFALSNPQGFNQVNQFSNSTI